MTGKSGDPAQQQLDTLGVSVSHLEHIFLEEISNFTDTTTGDPLSRDSKIYQVENLKGPPGVIRQKGANTRCPIDGRMGAAYVHCLRGEDHVGEATKMLSYSWSYTIGDIVDTLSEFCHQNNLDPKRTYVWICCLCVNQHRVVENNSKEISGMISPTKVDFFAIFGDRVKKIKHLLAMMAPWKAPVALTRVWCIFEIFTAHSTDGCKVDILMPPKEKYSLEQDVINNDGGIDALYETLGNTKVENAKASVDSDRRAILARVIWGVGYQPLNHEVNKLLREWMLSVLTQLVDSRENTNDKDYVDFCNRIGAVLKGHGELDAAMKLHQAALTICETVLGQNHEEATASTYHSIGNAIAAKGDYDDALAKLQKALILQEQALGKDHPDVAESYNSIGLVLTEMGDYEDALANYREALAMKLLAFGKHHSDVAVAYNNIGSVLNEMENYEGALSKYKEAVAIQESVLGKDHPSVATTYNNIGTVLNDMGDYEGALSKHNEALAIRLSVLGKDHIDVAQSYNNIGLTLEDMKDYEGALSRHNEALAIRLSAFGRDHPSVANTYNNIGSILFNMGDLSGALTKFEECLAIRKPVLGLDHPDTEICLDWIEDIKEELDEQ
ncbi:Kinesin light chain [Seminavis robusta]|uniref:Kinesin light chain n=1 Tax=Seminavis robusta TaxID=568900 RepID=A0A9N8F0H3_9STRA|nr:Kinesin light chain [Seminavis robusta]|eukprot:Sro2363_g324930.1 Kinesin light chain (613) ;mRNA; f:7316-9154